MLDKNTSSFDVIYHDPKSVFDYEKTGSNGKFYHIILIAV